MERVAKAGPVERERAIESLQKLSMMQEFDTELPEENAHECDCFNSNAYIYMCVCFRFSFISLIEFL